MAVATPVVHADPESDKFADALRGQIIAAIESAQTAGYQISRVTDSAILYTRVERDGPPGQPICGPRGNVSLTKDGGLSGLNETAIKNTYGAITLMVASSKQQPPAKVRIEPDPERKVCSLRRERAASASTARPASTAAATERPPVPAKK
jgi:hypothetical protein